MNDEFTGLGQVLGQQGPPHVTAQGVLNVDKHAMVSLVQDLAAFHKQWKLKGNLSLATGNLSWLQHVYGAVDNLDWLSTQSSVSYQHTLCLSLSAVLLAAGT